MTAEKIRHMLYKEIDRERNPVVPGYNAGNEKRN